MEKLSAQTNHRLRGFLTDLHGFVNCIGYFFNRWNYSKIKIQPLQNGEAISENPLKSFKSVINKSSPKWGSYLRKPITDCADF
jgi:ABC-type Zn uptake system ZnuABC Zn-binding protein ZnuA